MNAFDTKSLMQLFGIQPARSLGQNFLIDDRVVWRIVENAGLEDCDLVIEIGPGLGALTGAIAEKAGQVFAIEIDDRLIPVLSHELANRVNVRILHQDACGIDLHKLACDWQGPVKIAANLPYYITTELVQKFLIEVPYAARMVLMMQKEAGDRLFARPGNKDYGPVAVLASLYGSIQEKLSVPPSAFIPQPGVASQVIWLAKYDAASGQKKMPDDRMSRAITEIPRDDLPAFNRFLQSCFSQRRKTLANCLKNSGYIRSAVELTSYLHEQQLRPDIRAEALQPGQFIDLYHFFGGDPKL